MDIMCNEVFKQPSKYKINHNQHSEEIYNYKTPKYSKKHGFYEYLFTLI